MYRKKLFKMLSVRYIERSSKSETLKRFYKFANASDIAQFQIVFDPRAIIILISRTKKISRYSLYFVYDILGCAESFFLFTRE